MPRTSTWYPAATGHLPVRCNTEVFRPPTTAESSRETRITDLMWDQIHARRDLITWFANRTAD
jgi:hypothetical protein